MKPWVPAESEIELSFVRSQGPGGQGVNTTSSAVHLRFDIRASSLPEWLQARLLALGDQRVTAAGEVLIKAQVHRSQEMNRADAIARLVALVAEVAHTDKPRRATKPTRGSQQRRLQGKAVRSGIKAGRGRVGTGD